MLTNAKKPIQIFRPPLFQPIILFSNNSNKHYFLNKLKFGIQAFHVFTLSRFFIQAIVCLGKLNIGFGYLNNNKKYTTKTMQDRFNLQRFSCVSPTFVQIDKQCFR